MWGLLLASWKGAEHRATSPSLTAMAAAAKAVFWWLCATSVIHHALVAGRARAFDGFRRKGQRIEAKRPANFPHPLWVRAGTSDILTHHMVIRRGEYDMGLCAGSPKIILDLGANIGLTAIWYANRYPDARIFCVECDRANYDLLVDNTRNYRQIETLHAAVWSEVTSLTVTDPGEGEWAYRVQEAGPGAPVGALTVDALMAHFGIDHIDLLKVDIEGAEFAVFTDPSAWIDRVHAIAAELHESITRGCIAAFDLATSDFPLRSARGLNVQVERRDSAAFDFDLFA